MEYGELTSKVKALGEELALPLWVGYIGNCGPGYDDRLWIVGPEKNYRYRYPGGAEGSTISAISWRTGQQPPWERIDLAVRHRATWLEENGYIDPLVDRVTARNIESVTELPEPDLDTTDPQVTEWLREAREAVLDGDEKTAYRLREDARTARLWERDARA